jgi:hypothetical protein
MPTFLENKDVRVALYPEGDTYNIVSVWPRSLSVGFHLHHGANGTLALYLEPLGDELPPLRIYTDERIIFGQETLPVDPEAPEPTQASLPPEL